MYSGVKISALSVIIVAVVASIGAKLWNNDGKIMNEIQRLIDAITARHFSKVHCIGVITEVPGIYLRESKVPVFYITNVRNTNVSESLLLTAINAGCLAFVIQVNDIKWMAEMFTKLFRSPASLNRANRRYVYLPGTHTKDGISHKTVMNEVFTCKSMNWMPDLLTVNILADQEALRNMGFMNKESANSDDIRAYGKVNFLEKLEIHFVLEIYTHKFVGKNPSETVLLDVWVPDKEFVYGVDLFPDKMENLMGKELKTMSLSYAPFTVMILDAEPPVFDGIEPQAILEFGKKQNITWILQYDFENWWGDVWDNGSGIGVLGAMAEDRTDFSFTALYMWNKGYLYMDYSIPFYQSGLTVVTPKPKMVPGWLIPVLPFTSHMWFALLISVVVITMLLFIVSKSSNTLLGGGITGQHSTLLECTFRTTGMLVLQVNEDQVDYDDSRFVPLRHLVAWVLVYFLVIASAYAGGLSAILTLPQFQPPIETVKDLADSGLQFYGTDGAYLFTIHNTIDPDLKKILGNYVVRTEEELATIAYEDKSSLLLERLQGGYFAHLKYLNEEVMQNKRLMKEAILPEYIVFTLSKGSPYKDNFNAILYKLRESGIPLYWEGETARKYLSQRLHLSILESRDPESAHHIKLSFEHVQGAFLLLVLGLLLSLLVFVLEIVRFYSTEKKKRERS